MALLVRELSNRLCLSICQLVCQFVECSEKFWTQCITMLNSCSMQQYDILKNQCTLTAAVEPFMQSTTSIAGPSHSCFLQQRVHAVSAVFWVQQLWGHQQTPQYHCSLQESQLHVQVSDCCSGTVGNLLLSSFFCFVILSFSLCIHIVLQSLGHLTLVPCSREFMLFQLFSEFYNFDGADKLLNIIPTSCAKWHKM